MIRSTRFQNCLLVAVALLIALPALGASHLADVSLGTVQVEWQPNGDYAGMKLRVSGPLGVVEQEFGEGENPLFDLRQLESAADGLYTWEIVATPRLDDGVRRAMAAARAAGDGAAEGRLRASGALPDAGSMVQSGSFRVAGGAILQPSGEAEPPAAGPRRVTSSAGSGDIRRTTAADQVIPDDLIVQGSLCVGFDCVNNESFGFDTVRLKENNTRIKFEDTSAGTFPSNDWQLTANDSASGGANKFSIEDISGARVPFTLTAGATTNSIFVDSTGRVGFRTSTPVLDLHVSTSNTPGIRLEQTSAGGFTAQTWDIAGNEANFFVRDVTGGSRLPFRIRPGAPTSSIDITNQGFVGIRTTSADAELTVQSQETNSDVVTVRASGGTDFLYRVFEASTGEGVFSVFDASNVENIRLTGQAQGRVAIGCASALNADLTLNSAGGGTCGVGTESTINAGATAFTVTSSRTIKENIEPVAADGILDRMAGVDVYTYDFINGPKDNLGLMAEDFHQIFGRGSERLLNGQEIEMALWLAVKELAARTERLDAKDQALERLRAENQELAERLEALEVALSRLD